MLMLFAASTECVLQYYRLHFKVEEISNWLSLAHVPALYLRGQEKEYLDLFISLIMGYIFTMSLTLESHKQ